MNSLFITSAIIGLLPLGMVPLSAQDMPSLDVRVSSVVTGGYWETQTQRGRYRAIVVSGGWEHVSSQLRIEWLLEDPDKQEIRVLRSTTIDSIPDWVYSLGAPSFVYAGKTTQLRVDGTEPRELTNASWLITLGAPGQYSVATPP